MMNGLTMDRPERAAANTAIPDANMDHWRVCLRYQGRKMTLYYSKGYGHKGAPPELAEVVESLVSDARMLDYCGGQDELISEYGYALKDTARVWRALEAFEQKLRRLFGDDYNAFMGEDYE